MLSKSRLKFLRGPIHKIPCHELHCKIVLYTRAYNKKYCQKHNHMAKKSRLYRKNIKKSQKDIQSLYGRYGETIEKLCLKCNEKFGSSGPFNKLCEPCNYVNETIKERIMDVSQSSSNSSNRTNNVFLYDDVDY